MGAPTGRFIGDKEMFVFKNDQVHIEQKFVSAANGRKSDFTPCQK